MDISKITYAACQNLHTFKDRLTSAITLVKGSDGNLTSWSNRVCWITESGEHYGSWLTYEKDQRTIRVWIGLQTTSQKQRIIISFINADLQPDEIAAIKDLRQNSKHCSSDTAGEKAGDTTFYICCKLEDFSGQEKALVTCLEEFLKEVLAALKK